jgi:hypothetical protein
MSLTAKGKISPSLWAACTPIPASSGGRHKEFTFSVDNLVGKLRTEGVLAPFCGAPD